MMILVCIYEHVLFRGAMMMMMMMMAFTLLGMNVLPSSRVRAEMLLLLVVSSDASEDAVINGESRKLER